MWSKYCFQLSMEVCVHISLNTMVAQHRIPLNLSGVPGIQPQIPTLLENSVVEQSELRTNVVW